MASTPSLRTGFHNSGGRRNNFVRTRPLSPDAYHHRAVSSMVTRQGAKRNGYDAVSRARLIFRTPSAAKQSIVTGRIIQLSMFQPHAL